MLLYMKKEIRKIIFKEVKKGYETSEVKQRLIVVIL